MLTNLSTLARKDPVTFAKRIHRYTHVHPQQLTYLCDKAGILDKQLEQAIERVDSACGVCVRNGRPLPSKKVSLSHINEAFNEEVQVDFTFFTVHASGNPNVPIGTKYTIIVFTDAGTKYNECDIVSRRAAVEIISAYDRLWICRHGASRSISADDEYNKKGFREYLACHDMTFKPRPTRRHNKTGIVERQNGRLKEILRRLIMERCEDDIQTLIARASFFANIFAGSDTLSAFELARGYQPAILGLPHQAVSPDILEAHTQQKATRALQRVLRSKTPNVPTQGMFKPNDIIWVWYASSKNNEPDEWIRAQVVRPHEHYIEVRRFKNGQPCRGATMKPAYEDIRIAPQGELARSLMEDWLETTLGYSDLTERGEEHGRNSNNAPSNATTSLLTIVSARKEPADDIGTYATQLENDKTEIATTLKSEKQRILDNIYNNIGSHQVSRSKLSFAPPWILEEAFRKEYDSNWSNSYVPIPDNKVPKDANIITSHTLYKVKTDEDGMRTLKSRVVPHGNHDDEKDDIRKDSATAQLNIIRLLLAVVTFLGMRLATADIKGAYLQSGPIQRDVYVRPPQEWKWHETYIRGALWKLLSYHTGLSKREDSG